jgi:hypothetical protein
MITRSTLYTSSLQRTTRSEHCHPAADRDTGLVGSVDTGFATGAGGVQVVDIGMGAEVGVGSLRRWGSCGWLLVKNLLDIELPEKVFRCFERGLSFTEGVDEAAVDTDTMELMEAVRCRQPKEASEDAIESLEESSLRAWLSRFEPYIDGSRLEKLSRCV